MGDEEEAAHGDGEGNELVVRVVRDNGGGLRLEAQLVVGKHAAAERLVVAQHGRGEELLHGALGVGEVKFSGMVLPTMKKLEYIVELRRVIRRKFTLGTGDGWLKADGETIYTAKDLKVGLFQADDAASAEA